MARLFSLRAVVVPAALVAGAAMYLIAGPNPAAPNLWDAKNSADLARALHYMHEVWNQGDMDAVRNVIAGDDLLVTFELGADNRTPVPLRSRQQILDFMKNVEVETGQQDTAYEMEMPKMHCRANGQFGVCTEECTVHLKHKSGADARIDKLFGTAVAVKYPDGWKWIQWHMSVGPAAPAIQANASPLAKQVRLIDEYKTPGIESELSGIYPHPTDDNLYYVLANRKPPYRYGQKPMLPVEYRGKLLTVNRAGQVLKAVSIVDDDFGGLTFVDGKAYIATTNSAEILKADPETGAILARFQLPSPAGGLDYDRDRKALIAQLYVGHPHLAVVDPANGQIKETLWSDESAMGLIKVSGDWLCTWASGWDPGSFSELRLIDQTNGHVLTRMKLDKIHSSLAPARGPQGAAFLSLVTVDSATGQTVIRRYGYNNGRS